MQERSKTKPKHTGQSWLLLLGSDVAVWEIAAVTLLQIEPFIWALWVVRFSGHHCFLAFVRTWSVATDLDFKYATQH